MNFKFFGKGTEIESRDRKKCNKCHVYMKDDNPNIQCDYCLGLKTRNVRKIGVENK